MALLLNIFDCGKIATNKFQPACHNYNQQSFRDDMACGMQLCFDQFFSDSA